MAFRLRRCVATLTLAMAPAVAAPAADPAPRLGHVEVRGESGPPLVLVAGSPSDWTVWEGFMERNQNRFRMHAVTLPGVGGTPRLDVDSAEAGETPLLDNAVAAISALIAERGLKQAIVIGHAEGGQIAMRLGLEHADQVGGLIIVDGFPGPPRPGVISDHQREQRLIAQRQSAANVTEDGWRRGLRESAYMGVLDPEVAERLLAMFAKTPAAVGAAYALEAYETDLQPNVKDLKPPTLVLGAIGDTTVLTGFTQGALREHWQECFAPAPNATVQFVEDSRRHIMLDRPQDFDRAVIEFVGGVTSGAGARDGQAGRTPR